MGDGGADDEVCLCVSVCASVCVVKMYTVKYIFIELEKITKYILFGGKKRT